MVKSRLIAVVLGALGSVEAASASLTQIQSPAGKEASQAQILSEFYGGTFVSNGNNFTNGSITAVRLDDSGADSTFKAGTYSVNTIAKFANRNEGFGYEAGESGGAYHKLFQVGGSNFSATGLGSFSSSGDFRFAMNGVNAIYTSQASDNANQKDAAVTYRIQGAGNNLARYAIFWENLNADEPKTVKTHNDYNDLVVQVSQTGGASAGGSATAVPLPAGVWTGSAMLTAILILRSRGKLKLA